MSQKLGPSEEQLPERAGIAVESKWQEVVIEEGDDRPLATGSSIPDRMRYYHTRFDNDSSDDEGSFNSVSFQESKLADHGALATISDNAEEEQETDGEYLSMTNEYVPLNETGGLSMQEDDKDDYGDFQTSHIAAQLTETAIDNIIHGTLNHREFAPRVMNDNFLDGEAKNEGELHFPPRVRMLASVNVGSDAIEDWKPFAGTNSPQSENAFMSEAPSIPPLTEDKISKIKDVMSKITLKPPSISSAALADALEQSRLRMGDEISK